MSPRRAKSSKREALTEIGHRDNVTSDSTSSDSNQKKSPEPQRTIRPRRKLRRTDDLIFLNTPPDDTRATKKQRTLTKKSKFVETLPRIENVAEDEGPPRKMLHARRRIEAVKSLFEGEETGENKSASGSEVSPADGGRGKRKRRKRGSKKKSSIGKGDTSQDSKKENEVASSTANNASSDSDRNYSRVTRKKKNRTKRSPEPESEENVQSELQNIEKKTRPISENEDVLPVRKLINVSTSENDSVEFNINKIPSEEGEEEEGEDDLIKATEDNKKTSRQSVRFDIILDDKLSLQKRPTEPPTPKRLGRSSQSGRKSDINTTINTTYDGNEERRLTFELDKSSTSIDVLKSLSNERQLEATAQSNASIKSKNDKIFLIRRKSLIVKTPPVGTSTPAASRRNPLMQEAADSPKNKNPDKSVTRKPSFRTKLPNFTLIHQKAFNKMENLEELTHRRAERAKILLSGRKPSDSTIKDSPVPVKSPQKSKSKKQLEFNTNNSVDFKSVSTTPAPLVLQKTLKISQKPTPIKSTSRGAKTPVKHLRPSPSDRNRGGNVGSSVLFATRGLSPVPKIKPKPQHREGFTRFGFKTTRTADPVSKAEEMRAVISKSKIQKNNTEEKRHVLKNVRLNRRFELLMKMRK